MPILSELQRLNLEWYFNVAPATFFRSNAGPMLDALLARRYDSDGNPIQGGAKDWCYMRLKPDVTREPSYVPDHGTSMRAAEISRRLMRLQSENYRALELYYGPVGAQWEAALNIAYRFNCLMPETEEGRSYLAKMYERPEYKAHSPQAIMLQETQAEKNEPMYPRTGDFRIMEGAALKLLWASERAYNAV